jgi:hypothetical protein
MGDAGGAPGLDAAPQGSAAAASAAASPQPGVPREGLSLDALRAFAAAHAGLEYTLQTKDGPVSLRFEQLTTAQVVDVIVKPATEKRGAHAGAGGGGDCTYAELLLAQARGCGGREAVGPLLGLRLRRVPRWPGAARVRRVQPCTRDD